MIDVGGMAERRNQWAPKGIGTSVRGSIWCPQVPKCILMFAQRPDHGRLRHRPGEFDAGPARRRAEQRPVGCRTSTRLLSSLVAVVPVQWMSSRSQGAIQPSSTLEIRSHPGRVAHRPPAACGDAGAQTASRWCACKSCRSLRAPWGPCWRPCWRPCWLEVYRKGTTPRRARFRE